MSTRGDLLIGVDIGGTFTDVVVRGPGAATRIMKIPSTRNDPSLAVLQALERMEADWDLAPQQVTRFVHGTTVATNAVLERKGSCVGLITTEGFRDVLEIGRQMRHQMYDLALDPETPAFLAPGRFRREIPERVGATGEVLRALDEAAVAVAADELIAAGAQAIAVVFLFSFLNDAHERRAREIVAARHPGVFVSLSCEVDPAFREYERTVVTTFDAYVKPVVDRYLANLDAGLAAAHVPAPLQIMQSRGGISGSATARLRPVRLFLSGPAAGVIGARMVGEAAGCRNLITVDIGGTSCDIALIEDGTPALRSEGVIDGYPVRTSMVDVNSIGSGGGSIAWLDAAKGLRVGPHSAGSEPGPACYRRGGTRATVTDADLLLGRLDAGYFAGGAITLAPQLAAEAVLRDVGEALALDAPMAAYGVSEVVDENMANAGRVHAVESGRDIADYTMITFGGAGPVHAARLCEKLGISRFIVPPGAGVGSAIGFLRAPFGFEAARSAYMRLDEFDAAAVNRLLESLTAEAVAFARQGIGEDEPLLEQTAYMRYAGQGWEIPVDIAVHRRFVDGDRAGLMESFEAAYRRFFGRPIDGLDAEIVSWSVKASSLRAAVTPIDEVPALSNPTPHGRRDLFDAGSRAFCEAAVFHRDALATGACVRGPAVIAERETSTILTAAFEAIVQSDGCLLVRTTGSDAGRKAK